MTSSVGIRRALRRGTAVVCVLVLASCGSSSGTNGINARSEHVDSILVTPASVTLAPGATQRFSADVRGTPGVTQTVTWSIEGGSVNGGRGTIDRDGTYRAPLITPNESARVLARSTVDLHNVIGYPRDPSVAILRHSGSGATGLPIGCSTNQQSRLR